jgi:hypothetical protein
MAKMIRKILAGGVVLLTVVGLAMGLTSIYGEGQHFAQPFRSLTHIHQWCCILLLIIPLLADVPKQAELANSLARCAVAVTLLVDLKTFSIFTSYPKLENPAAREFLLTMSLCVFAFGLWSFGGLAIQVIKNRDRRSMVLICAFAIYCFSALAYLYGMNDLFQLFARQGWF